MEESVRYLEAESGMDTARRFVFSLEETFKVIAQTPKIGRPALITPTEAQDVRIWRVSTFNDWLIFYRPTETTIEIIRVLHGARDLTRLMETTRW
jgi:toxin ParE1/3/4